MGSHAWGEDKILTVKFQEQCKIRSTEWQIAISNGRDKHQIRNDFYKNFGSEYPTKKQVHVCTVGGKISLSDYI